MITPTGCPVLLWRSDFSLQAGQDSSTVGEPSEHIMGRLES